MRVTIPLANQSVVASEESPVVQGAKRKGDVSQPSDSSAHTPSLELAGLLGDLSNVPELRQEVIQEVASRLAKGELSTPQSLDQTVQAILGTVGT